MICKASQRGGGGQLAAHLLNAHDNERVEVEEIRGSVAKDLAGAFRKWFAQSKASVLYLFSILSAAFMPRDLEPRRPV